jgi:two-component sensor histidine kinase
MKKAFFLIAMMFSLFSTAQQTKKDSLELLYLQEKEDTVRIRLFFELIEAKVHLYEDDIVEYADTLKMLAEEQNNSFYLGQSYNFKGRYYDIISENDSSRMYYHLGLEYAKRVNNMPLKASFYGNIALTYMNSNSSDSVLYYLEKAIEINKALKNNTKLLINYYNLSLEKDSQKKTEEALQILLKADSLATLVKEKRYDGFISSMLGIMYRDVGDLEKAKIYLKNSIKIFTEIENKYGLSTSYGNLGGVYGDKEEFHKAISFHKKALTIAKEINNLNSQGISTANIGRNYLNLKKLDSALIFLNEARAISFKTEDEASRARIAKDIADIYLYKKRYRESLKYIDESIKISTKNNYKESLSRAQLLKASILEELGDFREAYTIFKKGNQTIDSLESVEKLELVKTIETKYQTEKKEKENLQLKQEKAEQSLALSRENRNKWMFGTALLLSLITLGVFGYYYRKNQKQKQFIESLQKELHHRVKNNLSIIDSFIEVSKEKITDPQQIASLQDLQNRIESINAVHRQLYQNQDVTKLGLKKYLTKIQENVAKSFNNPHIEIITHIPEKSSMQADKSFPVGLIVNEFLTNSFKYAFKEGEKGRIKIQLEEGKKSYKLNLSDTGKGLPEDFDVETTPTFGMRIIQLLTEQLKGKMSIQNKDGLHLSVEFPK